MWTYMVIYSVLTVNIVSFNGIVKRVPGFHCTQSYWQVMIFGSSGLVDRSSECLLVWNIPCYGFI